MGKNYELIEHTADVGIRVKADDLKELFKNAALAMFDIIAVRYQVRSDTKEIKIEQNAVSLDELFINWLNELLSLSSAKEIIFSDFKISEIDDKHINVVAMASSSKNYKVNVEIKAATYHQLKIEKLKEGWQAEVIFDV